MAAQGGALGLELGVGLVGADQRVARAASPRPARGRGRARSRPAPRRRCPSREAVACAHPLRPVRRPLPAAPAQPGPLAESRREARRRSPRHGKLRAAQARPAGCARACVVGGHDICRARDAQDHPRRHGRLLRRRSSSATTRRCAGGRSPSAADASARGVVLTASYEARAVRRALGHAVGRALRSCARELVFVRPRLRRLQAGEPRIRGLRALHGADRAAVARRGLSRRHRDRVGPTARRSRSRSGIKDAIRAATGLTASAGVSFNKFLAKIASDWRSPTA